jgi:uncharacterized protein (DUF1501 family)
VKRRKFIRNIGVAGSGAFTLAGIPISVQSKALETFRSVAGSDNDKVLVILQLHGGNDGLNTLIPVEQYDTYYSRRANIAIPAANSVRKMIPLDGTLPSANQVGLHPDMLAAKKMYDQGKVNFIQGVSYKNNNGSHFRGRDIRSMGGGSDDYYSSGWVGRYLQNDIAPQVYPDDYPNADNKDPLALELGSEVSLLFHQEGNIPSSISIGNDPESLAKLVEELEGFEDEGLDPRGTPPEFLRNSPYGKEMNWLLGLEDKSEDYAGRLFEVYQKSSEASVTYPETYPFNAPKGSLKNRLTPQLKLIARLLDGGGDGVKTKVFLLKLGGFDTHAEQVESYDPTMGVHASQLYHITSAMEAFQKDLKERGIEDRVLTVTTSEFGRRIQSNGSYGTDHGKGGPVMVFGKGVQGGVIGTTPDMNKSNVDMQVDYRQVYATILKDWMEVDEDIITNTVFYGNFIDGPKEEGGSYSQLPLIGDNLVTSVDDFLESRFVLKQNHPNPARRLTNIEFYVNSAGYVQLSIRDMKGRTVKQVLSAFHRQGEYKVPVDLQDLDAGTYIYQISQGDWKASKKMVVVK